VRRLRSASRSSAVPHLGVARRRAGSVHRQRTPDLISNTGSVVVLDAVDFELDRHDAVGQLLAYDPRGA
jgi:hypothetical protein